MTKRGYFHVGDRVIDRWTNLTGTIVERTSPGWFVVELDGDPEPAHRQGVSLYWDTPKNRHFANLCKEYDALQAKIQREVEDVRQGVWAKYADVLSSYREAIREASPPTGALNNYRL